MADYVVVPHSNYTDAANLYTDGADVGSNSTYSHIRVVTRSNTIVRYGQYYHESISGSLPYCFAVNSTNDGNTTCYILGLRESGNTAEILYSVSNFGLSGAGNGLADGWVGDTYNDIYTVSGGWTPIPSLTIWATRTECFQKLTGTPIVNPGVHVEFHPVYVPRFPGVHVQFNPVLSDSNAQGGTSVPGGGDGTFDETSDAIPIPSLPSISTVDTGLVTLFRPTQQELAALGSYLWTNFTDFIDNLQKLFTNPMDYFIAFNIFPVSPLVTNARNIYIGNWATEISMAPVANQWYEFDCGTVTLQKYWGSALDYAPNTKVQLMLPYIGSVQLNTDEVMGQQIGVKYRIDLLSGSCVAMVTVNGNVYYQFTGECAVAVPLTGADWSRVYSAVIGAVGTAIAGGVGAVATGNAGGAAISAIGAGKAARAASSAGNTFARLANTHTRGVQAARDATIAAMNASAEAAQNAANASGTVANGIRATRLANSVNNTVGQVMSAKVGISHSGTISGSAGMLGVRDAYLIIEYPNQSLAKDYKHFVGYPSNMYARLGTLSGYTEVEQVIPEGIWGTDDELAELIDALKGGVYL